MKKGRASRVHGLKAPGANRSVARIVFEELRKRKTYSQVLAQLHAAGYKIKLKSLRDVANRLRRGGYSVPKQIKFSHTEEYLAQKRSGPVLRGPLSKALLEGLNSGKGYPEILSELQAAGHKTSLRKLTRLSYELRRRGYRLPELKKNLRKKAMLIQAREVLRAEESGLANAELAGMLGISVKEVSRLKNRLRKGGFDLKYSWPPRKFRLPVAFTPEERQWVTENHPKIMRVISQVCRSRKFSEVLSNKFTDYVFDTLPLVLRKYDPNKLVLKPGKPAPPKPASKLTYVKGTIFNWLSRDFVRIELAKTLSVTEKDAGRLIGLLLDMSNDITVEDSATRRKISRKKAAELLLLYSNLQNLQGAGGLHLFGESI